MLIFLLEITHKVFFGPTRRVETLTVFSGDVDVEIKAVLALVLDKSGGGVQVVCEPHRQHDFWQNPVHVLRADWCKLSGVADLLP